MSAVLAAAPSSELTNLYSAKWPKLFVSITDLYPALAQATDPLSVSVDCEADPALMAAVQKLGANHLIVITAATEDLRSCAMVLQQHHGFTADEFSCSRHVYARGPGEVLGLAAAWPMSVFQPSDPQRTPLTVVSGSGNICSCGDSCCCGLEDEFLVE